MSIEERPTFDKVRVFVVHARNYAKTLWTWVCDPKKGWGVVAVLMLTALAVYLVPWVLEKSIRWAGLTLQLLGLATVMFGLAAKATQFSLDNPATLFWKWIKAFPTWSPRPQTITVSSGSVGFAGAGSTAFGRAGIGRNATTDQRLFSLERDVEWLFQKELPAVRNEQRQLEQRLSERMDKQQVRTSEQIAAVQARLRGAVAGDVTLEWAGVVLLVFGLILGTGSPEIAGWFGN